ncbi:MAG: hypothetical protein R3A13_01280 [Bdellovibrionota bacterium]
MKPLVDISGPAISASFKKALEDPSSVGEPELNAVLNLQTTKVYQHNKVAGEFETDAKHILLTMSDPGAFNATMPLIKKLLTDPRCCTISVITDGVGSLAFADSEEEAVFTRINPENTPLYLKTMLATTTDRSYGYDDVPTPLRDLDVVISTTSAVEGPERTMTAGAKSLYGAGKHIMIYEGWSTNPGASFLSISDEEVDAVICNDELAKQCLLRSTAKFSSDRILPLGTANLDVPVTQEGFLRKEGRRKLGLKADEKTVLFVGNVSGANSYPNVRDKNPEFNEQSWYETIEACIEAAKLAPDKNFALLLRTHPRDPKKNELIASLAIEGLPTNLRLIDATGSIVSMDEAAYASEIILAVNSTENLRAPHLNRTSAFLAYTGISDKIFDAYWPEDLRIVMQALPGVGVVSSKADLIALMLEERFFSIERTATDKSYVDGILDHVLN